MDKHTPKEEMIKDLENIFKHRKKVIDKLFENNDYKSYTSDSIMGK